MLLSLSFSSSLSLSPWGRNIKLWNSPHDLLLPLSRYRFWFLFWMIAAAPTNTHTLDSASDTLQGMCWGRCHLWLTMPNTSQSASGAVLELGFSLRVFLFTQFASCCFSALFMATSHCWHIYFPFFPIHIFQFMQINSNVVYRSLEMRLRFIGAFY